MKKRKFCNLFKRMGGSIFGRFFKVATFGESHGAALGCIVDGCPSNLNLSESDIQTYLDKRKPGQSSLSTPRKEGDECKILSGVFEGRTLGTPIAVVIENQNQKSSDYSEIARLWRPSHADFTYDAKFGIRDPRGGGRSSARETAARVAAGAIARKCMPNVEIRAWVESVHSISMPSIEGIPTEEQVEANEVRCPHAQTASRMAEFIKKARAEGDSVGGVIRCRIANVPAGLGEPVFDRLEADLAKAMLSIPASKGFEIGSGFAGARMFGSAHNDEFFVGENGEVCTKTNYSGGVQGGISNGQIIDFRVAFKPTATILKEQKTLTTAKEPTTVVGRGRHDPCVLPRAVAVVEAMAALVLADAVLAAGKKLPL